MFSANKKDVVNEIEITDWEKELAKQIFGWKYEVYAAKSLDGGKEIKIADYNCAWDDYACVNEIITGLLKVCNYQYS